MQLSSLENKLPYTELNANLPALIQKGEPAIITGAIADSPIRHWEFDHLAERFNDLEVDVCTAQNSVYALDQKSGEPIEKDIKMPFGQYIRYLQEQDDGGRTYMQMGSLQDKFAELLPEVEVTRYFPKQLFSSGFIWIGPNGTVSPLHYDPENNFLIQVKGCKKLILFKESELTNLYPYHHYNCSHPHLSQVDIENPNFEKFPALANAQGLEVVLNEGDMLFMPSGCWHQVYSQSLSISVNLWWSPMDWQFVKPHNRRLLYWRRNRMEKWLSNIVMSDHCSLIDIGKQFVDEGDVDSGYLFYLSLLERVFSVDSSARIPFSEWPLSATSVTELCQQQKQAFCLDVQEYIENNAQAMQVLDNNAKVSDIWPDISKTDTRGGLLSMRNWANG